MASVGPEDSVYRSWLKDHGSVFSIHHEYKERMYIFRRLTRRELRLSLFIENTAEREDEIVQTCLLWPADWKTEDHLDEPAGIVQVICDEILRVSGIGNPMELLLKYQDNVSTNIEIQMEATIEHIFCGGGSFRKYEDMSPDEFYDTYTRAAYISTTILGKELKIQQVEETPTKRKGEYRPIKGREQKSVIDSISSGTAVFETNMSDAQKAYMKLQKRAQIRKRIMQERK